MSITDTPVSTESAPLAPSVPDTRTPGQVLADKASHPEPPKHEEPPHALDDPKPRRSRRNASPSDVPTIQNLSGLLKDLTPRDETDAPRVAELKGRLRKALDLDTAPAAEPAKAAEPAPVSHPAPQLPEPSAWSEAEPTLDQFVGKSDDPYAAWQRAVARYDRRKDEHESRQAWLTQQQQGQQQQAQREWQQVEQGFVTRLQKFAADSPADFQKLATSPKLQNVPPIMDAAIKLSPTSEADLLHWLDDPTMLDELRFQTYGKPVTPEFVQYVQRKLSARPAAGPTGAAGARPVLVAPRPPTPVRTGAVLAGSPPDDEDDSLDAHARKYGAGSRRR